MVTTHLGDLKTYALSRTRAENAAVEFDAETLQPRYRLHIGQFGESCALKIARRLQVPRRVLRRAHKYFRRRRGRGSRELEQLQEMRAAAEEARTRATEAMAEAERSAAEFRQKAELLQQEAAVSHELDKFRASLRAGDSVRVSRFSKSGRVLRVDASRKKATVVVGAVQWELPLDELLPIPASGQAESAR
jgi:DNA mismatch repair protein MutS2